ncbi:hypothetical protein [Pantoea sp. BAV 3049]|uniref:hypothetical protein n=1 Tax=Pantoea sp. BAV 3049 TaxID=2654188 RepID=UPI00131AF9C0|nr:hypothetical protein [Pantoea sp. BAV 3049]
MNAETIKDFLVSLGFQVDEAGYRKFESVLTGTTAQAIKMGAAVEAAALSVVAYTAKIASGLDNLYWASQRTGATVKGIQAIGYAASQAGGSAEAARGSLESLSRFMRNSPGAEGFLNRLGVQTRDASGNMRDMASIFTGVGQKLNNMPYYRANQYAQMLGIDEGTLMAMRRGLGQFSTQYTQMAKAIGYNADTAAVSSSKFMTSLRSFGQMAGMARDKIGSNLAEGLTGALDKLRKQVLDNFPKIEGAITSGVRGLLRLADIIGRVVFRLIQTAGDVKSWWDSLDKSTQELIELVAGLTVAWWALNRAMLASPITWVLGLAAGIALLWEDYKTWKEGGKSLIDWGKWEPDIKSALKSIGELKDDIVSLAKEAAKLFGIDPKAWSLKWEFSNLTHNLGELGKMLKLIGDLLSAINEGRWSDAASIGKQLLKQGSDQPDAMPGVTASATASRNWLLEKYRQANGAVNRYLPEWAGGSGNLPDRNNNPGNLRPVGGGGFRSFGTALEGWGAMRNQLMRYFTGKTTGKALKTITDIVSTWAPSSENDTGKYISDISKWMGVAPDAALNLNNPQVMTSLMQSMARKEGFSAWNSPLAGQAAGATVNQETNIHIHGVTDPQRAGMEVADRQTAVNSRITQLTTAGPR